MRLCRGWKLGRGPGSFEGLLLRPPAEESMWLVEQRAAVATKPGARRPCLVKNKIKMKINDPGAGRLPGSYEKSPAWVS